MDIASVLNSAILGITLVASLLALYKSFKTAPKEVKSIDADLSTKYQDLADRQFERANEYEVKFLEKTKEMEKTVALYEKEIERYDIEIATLSQRVEQHDQKIAELKSLIADQEAEIAILRKKALKQESEIAELKDKVK